MRMIIDVIKKLLGVILILTGVGSMVSQIARADGDYGKIAAIIGACLFFIILGLWLWKKPTPKKEQ